MKSHDRLLRKFKNRAPASYRLDPILSKLIISFELHDKIAEEKIEEERNHRAKI